MRPGNVVEGQYVALEPAVTLGTERGALVVPDSPRLEVKPWIVR